MTRFDQCKNPRPLRFARALAVTAAFLLTGTSCAVMRPPAPAPRDVTQLSAYRWLQRQQGDGALLAFCEGNYLRADLYANALAAICFLQQGDRPRAERILSFFDKQYAAEFGSLPGGFPKSWNPADGTAYRDSGREAAGNAWLLIALNGYHIRTGSERYDVMTRGVARWLMSLQDPDGGVVSGFERLERMTVKTAAVNLLCSVALADYPAPRAGTGRWLANHMWIETTHRFRADTTTEQSSAEATALAVLALGREFASALGGGEARLVRGDRMRTNGTRVAGFAENDSGLSVSFEATAQMALAYQLAGSPERADRYREEMRRAFLPSLLFSDAAGLPCSASRPAWDGACDRIYTPAQVWFLFSAQGFNPLELPPTTLPGKP